MRAVPHHFDDTLPPRPAATECAQVPAQLLLREPIPLRELALRIHRWRCKMAHCPSMAFQLRVVSLSFASPSGSLPAIRLIRRQT